MELSRRSHSVLQILILLVGNVRAVDISKAAKLAHSLCNAAGVVSVFVGLAFNILRGVELPLRVMTVVGAAVA